MFDDWWPFCFVAIENFSGKKFVKHKQEKKTLLKTSWEKKSSAHQKGKKTLLNLSVVWPC